MTNKKPIKESENLVAQKLSFVQIDYKNYFDNSSRLLDQSNNLRRWEITVFTAFHIALLTRNQEISSIYYFLPVTTVFLFGLLDLSIQAGRAATGYLATEAEKLLQETDEQAFQSNIIDWQFGNHMSATLSRKLKLKFVYWSLKSHKFFVWHGGLFTIGALVIITQLSTINWNS